MAAFSFGRYKLKSGVQWLAVTTHPPRPDGACELKTAVRQGTAMVPKLGKQKESCLFTIAHFENKQGMRILPNWEWLLEVSVPSFSPIV
jgi:hypothetical protein